MFGFLRRRREEKRKLAHAYDAGRDFGVAITDAVDGYLGNRVQSIETNYLDVFRERLTTIYDDREHPAALVARAEYVVFSENVGEMQAKLRQEAHEVLRGWLDRADEIGARAEIEQLIDKRISDTASGLKIEALALLAEAIGEAGEGAKPSLPT